MKSQLLCVVIAGAGLSAIQAGQFRFGLMNLKQHQVNLQIARPPDALIEARTIAVKERAGVPFPTLSAVKLNLEQALSGDFTIAASTPEAFITFTITAYVPVSATRQVQNEKRSVVVGKETKKGFGGRPVEVDKYEERVVPVEYWVVEGSATLQAEVADAKGTLVDTFSDSADIRSKVEVAVQGVASKAQKQPPLLSQDAAMNELVQKLAHLVKRRYTTTAEPVEAFLAVDEELRSHYETVRSGQWEKALEAYQAVKMKKNPGDRLYNMAVCHEAVAHSTYLKNRSADEAQPHFEQAMKLYTEAKALDPGEKYFAQAEGRLRVAIDSFARLRDLNELQQRRMEQFRLEAERRRQEAKSKQEEEERKRAGEDAARKELESTRTDTSEESEFRSMVRTRLRAKGGKPADTVLEELRQTGERRYTLKPLEAKRVVHQEAKNLADYQERQMEYRGMVTDVLSDKRVTAEEREQMNRLAARLRLQEQEVQSIEADFPELAKPETPVKTPAPVKAKPPAAKKSQPSTPPPATTVAAPKPVPSPKPARAPENVLQKK